MSYLDDRATKADKVEPIERKPGEAHILRPSEMRVLLANVTPEFLPRLAIAGFAGVHSEEISPDDPESKSPLRWEEIDWKHKTSLCARKRRKPK
jgi:hypothetical protein